MSRIRHVTASDVIARAEGDVVRIAADERPTAFARDEARRLGLRLVEPTRAGPDRASLGARPRPGHRGTDHDVLWLAAPPSESQSAALTSMSDAVVREARVAGGRLVDRRRAASPERPLLLRFDWSGTSPARRAAFRARTLARLEAVAEGAAEAPRSENPRDSCESAELCRVAGVRGGFEG